MATQLDFYARKGTALPRFIYRQLAEKLQSAATPAERQAAVSEFLATATRLSASGDYLKMKWVLPRDLQRLLQPHERELIEQDFAELRRKRPRKLFDVYPHCADEFSLAPEFLEATFNATPSPLFTRDTPVFTIGSCFARNIARFLKSNGYHAENFDQFEDLNSPLSNALMLAVATVPEAVRLKYLRAWLEAILPGKFAARLEDVLKNEAGRLDSLREKIAGSGLLIVTLGNTIDYFLPDATPHPQLGSVNVAPKFLGVAMTEDVEQRVALSAILKRAGATVRISSFNETRAAISQLFESLRAINPAAPVVFTLSPIPIDSAIGVDKSGDYGPIELDCISKSTLRAAIAELLPAWAGRSAYYFPSYEIVRWVGAMLPIPNFGAEDAASRHVSGEILNAIFAFFSRKHGAGVLDPEMH